MTYEELKKIINEVNGCTFAGLDTITSVTLFGGKKNPMQGRVTKRNVGSNVMLFSNTDVNPYEMMVKRRLEAEGKDPAVFTVKPRTWGTRVENSPFIEHKGKYYLEVFFRSSGKNVYYLDGNEIEKDQIEGLESPTAKDDTDKAPAQGGLEDKVQLRTYSIESIEKIRINGMEIA